MLLLLAYLQSDFSTSQYSLSLPEQQIITCWLGPKTEEQYFFKCENLKVANLLESQNWPFLAFRAKVVWLVNQKTPTYYGRWWDMVIIYAALKMQEVFLTKEFAYVYFPLNAIFPCQILHIWEIFRSYTELKMCQKSLFFISFNIVFHHYMFRHCVRNKFHDTWLLISSAWNKALWIFQQFYSTYYMKSDETYCNPGICKSCSYIVWCWGFCRYVCAILLQCLHVLPNDWHH